jgi:multidrug efflux system membrane fusion protein
MLSRKLVVSSVLVAALAMLTACRSDSHVQQPPPPAVTVAAVEAREIVEWDEFTGRTEAVETVEVRPRVAGYIQEIRFRSGQLVNKGDVLFVIDPRWHKADYERVSAEFERAQARLQNAEREAKRAAQLLSNNVVSKEEAEARETRYQEAKAALLAAEAARDTARLDLDHTLVRAPITGRVSRELLSVGNYVSGTAGNATVLTTIVSVDPVYVYADIDENSLLKFNELARNSQLHLETKSNDSASANLEFEEPSRAGAVPVELQLADEEGFPHRGYIESFDNRVDPTTGSILLRAVFPNTDGRVVPGLFARIRIPASARHTALLIEERAIGTDQAQKFVFTLTETNTVAYRPVKLGPVIAGKRVIRSGLESGEQVVVNGLQRVRPGMPVRAQTDLASREPISGIAKR